MKHLWIQRDITMTIRNTSTNSSNKKYRSNNLLSLLVLTSIALVFIAVFPASASDGTQYMAGSPELSAAISGNNELSREKRSSSVL